MGLGNSNGRGSHKLFARNRMETPSLPETEKYPRQDRDIAKPMTRKEREVNDFEKVCNVKIWPWVAGGPLLQVGFTPSHGPPWSLVGQNEV